MAEEQSIQDQIKAIEAWALKAEEALDTQKYDEALKNLKSIDYQGRRLEWRSKNSLRALPDLKEIQTLKKQITQVRAACKEAMSSINNLIKSQKRKGKNQAEQKAIERNIKNSLDDATQNCKVMTSIAIKAAEFAETAPWFNMDIISKNKKVLEMFFKGEGFYKEFDQSYRSQIWNNWKRKKITLQGLKLSGVDLRGFTFVGIVFTNSKFDRSNFTGGEIDSTDFIESSLIQANFSGANVSSTRFLESKLFRANFEEAIIHGGNFSYCDLTEANFTKADVIRLSLHRDTILIKANFTGANLTNTNLEGADLKNAEFHGAILKGANFKNVKNCTLQNFELHERGAITY